MVAWHDPDLSIKTIDLAGPSPPRFSFEIFFYCTRWSDFPPGGHISDHLHCCPLSGWISYHQRWWEIQPIVPLERRQNTALWSMGKLFCESCIRHVLSGSRNCHFHFLFFVLQLLPWIVKHCLVVCLFLVHTEDRSLKAYFYIFISLQIFIQFKLNVWDNKAISGAA